jgi:hypothetical protein
MKEDTVLRKELLSLLLGGQAHMGLKAAENFPSEHYNSRPPNVEYTFWHLLEHIRFAQEDIIEYIRSANYREKQWPQDYWPASAAVCDVAGWQSSLQAIREGLTWLETLITSPQIDLQAGLPYAPDHTYLREIFLVADHNAYHLGELAILRQVMGLWHPDRSI